MRIDAYLFEKGLLTSRTKAKELILSGRVTVNKAIVTKASFDVSENDEVIIVSTTDGKYDSRA